MGSATLESGKRSHELAVEVGAGGELGQGVVLWLLLKGFAFSERVLDVGDHAADAVIRMINGEEVIDPLLRRHPHIPANLGLSR